MDCCENTMAMGRVVCPKPRRVGPSNFNNSVMPLRFHIRNDAVAFDSKPGAELLDVILRKEGFEAERCATVSSSPPFFFGSPPCRAPNPVVQDAHFRVEKLTTTVSSPSDSASLPSAHSRVKYGNKQAAVRVEGLISRGQELKMRTLHDRIEKAEPRIMGAIGSIFSSTLLHSYKEIPGQSDSDA